MATLSGIACKSLSPTQRNERVFPRNHPRKETSESFRGANNAIALRECFLFRQICQGNTTAAQIAVTAK